MFYFITFVIAILCVAGAAANAYAAYQLFTGDNILSHKQATYYPIAMASAAALFLVVAIYGFCML